MHIFNLFKINFPVVCIQFVLLCKRFQLLSLKTNSFSCCIYFTETIKIPMLPASSCDILFGLFFLLLISKLQKPGDLQTMDYSLLSLKNGDKKVSTSSDVNVKVKFKITKKRQSSGYRSTAQYVSSKLLFSVSFLNLHLVHVINYEYKTVFYIYGKNIENIHLR